MDSFYIHSQNRESIHTLTTPHKLRIVKLMDTQALQIRLVSAAARNKIFVYQLFLVEYALIGGVLLLGSYSLFFHTTAEVFFLTYATWVGKLALLMLLFVLAPGLLGRFGIQIRITRIITFYRRQLGITTFLLAFTHFMFVRGVYRLSGVLPLFSSWQLFEIVGLMALIILFFLFLTSNDYSVRRLGKWWKRLHRLVYLVIWLILLHTALQKTSIWSLLSGVWAVLEVISFIVLWRRNTIIPPTTQQVH